MGKSEELLMLQDVRDKAVVVLMLLLTGCSSRSVVPTQIGAVTGPPTAVAPASATVEMPTATTGQNLFFDHIDMSDAKSGWAWKSPSQLYRTDDGGSTWIEIHLQGKRIVPGGVFLDGQEAWLPGVPDANLAQTVFRTTDGGRTWTDLASLPGPDLSLYFHDPRNGWALNGIGAAGSIFYQAYKTMDGGTTWTQLQLPSRGASSATPAHTMRVATTDSLSFTPPGTIWIALGSGASTTYAGLTVLRDDGKTWQEINPPLTADLLQGQPPVLTGHPEFVTDQQAYLPVAVGGRLVFFESKDAGATWELLPPILPIIPMIPRVQFVSPENGFAVCGANLCSTHDGATSWQDIPTPFSFDPFSGGSHVIQFDFVDKQTGWAILTDADQQMSLVKTEDGGRTWIHMEPRAGF